MWHFSLIKFLDKSFEGALEYMRIAIRNSLVAALVLSTGVAQADSNQKDPWTAGVGVGTYFYEADEELNPGVLIEGRVGYDVSDRVTIETGVGYLPYLDARDGTENDSDAWHLNDTQGIRASADALYHLNEAGNRDWDPTVAATTGMLYTNNTLSDDRHFNVFYGVGAGIGKQLNDGWIARGDYRLLAVGSDAQLNHVILASLMYRFGSNGDSGDGLGAEGTRLKTIYYDFDSSALSADARNKLQDNAGYLKTNASEKAVLEGNCDERGTKEYNYALGERRARAAKDYLKTLGIDSERMDTVSYGEDRPADAGHTEAAWSKNRRTETIAK